MGRVQLHIKDIRFFESDHPLDTIFCFMRESCFSWVISVVKSEMPVKPRRRVSSASTAGLGPTASGCGNQAQKLSQQEKYFFYAHGDPTGNPPSIFQR